MALDPFCLLQAVGMCKEPSLEDAQPDWSREIDRGTQRDPFHIRESKDEIVCLPNALESREIHAAEDSLNSYQGFERQNIQPSIALHDCESQNALTPAHRTMNSEVSDESTAYQLQLPKSAQSGNHGVFQRNGISGSGNFEDNGDFGYFND